MDRKVAKELLHIQGWLGRVDEIIARGRNAYLADAILQEAGDALMMKLGEAANRLGKLDIPAPEGVDWALAAANRPRPVTLVGGSQHPHRCANSTIGSLAWTLPSAPLMTNDDAVTW